MLHSLFGLIPLLIAGLQLQPRMSWREVKLAIYVSEWPRYLSRHCRPGQRMFVLDQGPVYALGRLEALGKPFLRSDVYVRWKSRMTAAWAKKLNRIIVLDAVDPILVERIGGRTQAHETKGKSPEVGFEFLARHRRAFEEVIAAVEKAGGPEAHRIDTGSLPPGQIAAAVAAELGLVDRKPSA